jgi:hypothetical protein
MNVGTDGTGIFHMVLDSHMVLEPDERIPEHLVPEGRIDIPAEKTRKPRKKPVAKPAAKAVRVPKNKA